MRRNARQNNPYSMDKKDNTFLLKNLRYINVYYILGSILGI